ncbi:glycosyltransferase [Roseateles cellulosilyticus]|uniref:Glycosyltransferase n=1 Tax=Pelomonas cellulosilytica TaxID=2906762 RepID=A0ABS8XRB4_9BURK|nr:glycosyltransferase [Pelomonas sp. P8]MCE4553146.1 glycosyltransferase [Pelomonas sp. P8]
MPPALTAARAAPLHVLEVVGNAIVGGMESWVERFIERMPRERFRFTALVPVEGPFADRLRSLGAEVHTVPMADDPSWVSLQTTLALVQSQLVDVLHAHLPRAHVLAGLVGRLAERPVIATLHGREVGMLDLEVHRATGSHLCVVCRPSHRHALGLGVRPEQLSCVPNGVDTAMFQPRLRGHRTLRESLGLPQDATLLGFVGRLSPEKGPEVFLQAMHVLARRHVGAHAVIVGDGPMRASLIAQAEQLGLEGRVHLIGLREDMPAVYPELDVVVSTSHSEAMPLALMEAMACGLPVVATRVGGVPDLVQDGHTGWLAAPGDFHGTGQHCATLLADEALRRRMGRHARERVVARFDLGACVDGMAQLIERLAAPANAEAALAMPTRQFLRQS